MAANKRDVHILECSLRDSSYAVDFQFSPEHVRRVARGLEEAGFQFIEVGHGLGLGVTQPSMGIAAATDEEYLEATATALQKAKFGTFLIPGIADKKHLNLLREYHASFVRLGCNATESASVIDYISTAKDLGLMVFVNLMKSYTLPVNELVKIAKILKNRGADVLYLVDSAGGMFPEEVTNYVRAIKESVQDLKIGIHAHNNLQLAVANSLATIDAGGDFIDTTLRGVGRSAGNAQTEVVLGALQKKGYMKEIDLTRTFDVAEKIFSPILESLLEKYPHLNRMELSRGFNDIEITLGLARCHSSFLKHMHEVAQDYSVDLRKLVMEVSLKDCINPSRNLMVETAKSLSRHKK